MLENWHILWKNMFHFMIPGTLRSRPRFRVGSDSGQNFKCRFRYRQNNSGYPRVSGYTDPPLEGKWTNFFFYFGTNDYTIIN